MKLKYYLRGLGIGIIVTAAVMSVTAGEKTMTMTDEQIKERAVELGMIEDTFLADAVEKIDETKEAASTESISKQETQTASEKMTEQAAAEESKQGTEEADQQTAARQTEQDIEEPAEQVASKPAEQESNTDTSGSLLVINIKSGESSVSISKKLEEAGLVDSAAEYDKFLCQNGYDKKISAGSHQIAKGATEEEIAREITSR